MKSPEGLTHLRKWKQLQLKYIVLFVNTTRILYSTANRGGTNVTARFQETSSSFRNKALQNTVPALTSATLTTYQARVINCYGVNLASFQSWMISDKYFGNFNAGKFNLHFVYYLVIEATLSCCVKCGWSLLTEGKFLGCELEISRVRPLAIR